MWKKFRAGNVKRLPGQGQNFQQARFFLFCALLALLAGTAILLFGASSYWRQQLGSLKSLLPANVDMRLGRLTLSEAGDQGRTLVIEADTALYNQNEDSFLLEEVRAKVGPGPDYDITADAARYDQAAQVITLTGRVKILESGGGILLSERLILKIADGLLISESPFCYADPETDLEGSAFVYEIRDRRLTVEGPVELSY